MDVYNCVVTEVSPNNPVQSAEDESQETEEEGLPGVDQPFFTPSVGRKRPRTGSEDSLDQPPKAFNHRLTPDSARQDPAPQDDSDNREPSSDAAPKYSFVISGANDLQIGRLGEKVVGLIPPDSIVDRRTLSNDKKVALFRVKCSARYHAYVLNEMLKPDTISALRQAYGDETLTVRHYDPTARQTTLTNEYKRNSHVIVCDVPYDYSADYFREKIQKSSPVYASSVLSCHRIVSRKTERPTSLIRVICADEATANRMINECLQIDRIQYRCEKSHERPPPVPRCYRCQSTQHHITSCKSPICCAKCTGAHWTRDCPKSKEEFCCANCSGRHATYAWTCPFNDPAHPSHAQPSGQHGDTRFAPTAKPAGTNQLWSQVVQTPQTIPVNVPAPTTSIAETTGTNLDPESIKKDIMVMVNTELERNMKEISDLLSNKLGEQRSWIRQSLDDTKRAVYSETMGRVQSEWSKCIGKLELKLETETKHLQRQITEHIAVINKFMSKVDSSIVDGTKGSRRANNQGILHQPTENQEMNSETEIPVNSDNSTENQPTVIPETPGSSEPLRTPAKPFMNTSRVKNLFQAKIATQRGKKQPGTTPKSSRPSND